MLSVFRSGDDFHTYVTCPCVFRKSQISWKKLGFVLRWPALGKSSLALNESLWYCKCLTYDMGDAGCSILWTRSRHTASGYKDGRASSWRDWFQPRLSPGRCRLFKRIPIFFFEAWHLLLCRYLIFFSGNCSKRFLWRFFDGRLKFGRKVCSKTSQRNCKAC